MTKQMDDKITDSVRTMFMYCNLKNLIVIYEYKHDTVSTYNNQDNFWTDFYKKHPEKLDGNIILWSGTIRNKDEYNDAILEIKKSYYDKVYCIYEGDELTELLENWLVVDGHLD